MNRYFDQIVLGQFTQGLRSRFFKIFPSKSGEKIGDFDFCFYVYTINCSYKERFQEIVMLLPKIVKIAENFIITLIAGGAV
jgi:hypothetical protein